MRTLTVGNVAQIDDVPILSVISMTSWRWVQSDTNRSPCYLANIRVIFENNSEPAVEKCQKPCGAGTSDHRANFDNREKQGGSLQSNTVLPAKNRERKDRAAKPPTSPARRLHGCPTLPAARCPARFVSQDVGGSKSEALSGDYIAAGGSISGARGDWSRRVDSSTLDLRSAAFSIRAASMLGSVVILANFKSVIA